VTDCETWSGTAVWRNWVGNQACEPRGLAVPRNEAEVRSLVAHASRAGLAVRVAGAGHSFTPIVLTDGLLLDLRELAGVEVGVETSTVTAGGGARIGQLGDPLWEAGLSLVNMGDIDGQAIGGAVATGTHGTGVTLPSFSASLRHARLVTASGEVVEVSAVSDPDLFRAAQVSIGMLGVMTRVTLEVTEAYVLHERLSYVELDELLERYDDLLHGHRHFSFFYFPSERSAALYGEATTAPAPGTARRDDVCSVKLMDALDTDTPPGSPGLGERIDRLDRICPSEFEPNFHELEYMLPLEQGKDALLALRTLLRTRHVDAIYPVECRFTAGDDAYLSPNRGGATAVISVSGEPGTDYWPFLHDCDAIFREHGGRPHWGKLHFMEPERLDELFPEIERFRELRRGLDPSGVFLNPHLRELFA
jgi:FAD/FMN-containing dehydrogenase